ncbi:DUF368 domain-containing protein [Halioxenophilus aromaticivorans]|uniref:DUF368 domain-containing protein n=1 Tax=Halioxenophilus aromaticivorans TaxID=1306992 RepID=A0AAV3U8T6_9ALTE
MAHSFKHYFLVFVRGLAMGAADVVPGVSGGTIAFITGIYEELINSIKSIGPQTLVTLVKRGPAAAWQEINGNFLLAVFAGIVTSAITLAGVIEYALQNHPILVWSFFWGLVLASVWHLLKQFRPLTPTLWAWLVVGMAIALAISVLRPVALPGHWWVMALGGSVAICAMILPGVSGSFILLLLGLYSVFIEALSNLQLGLLASFVLGAGLGLLLFSRFLAWLLRHYHNPTLAVLTGFLLGSLNVIWPWKQVIETRLDRHGEEIPVVQQNLLPWQFTEATGEPNYLIMAIIAAVVGLVMVLAIEFISRK